MGDIPKRFLTANEVYEGSFRLAQNIYDSGYRPDHIVALWRGGTPVGMVIQEVFKFYNHNCNHVAVKALSYHGIDKHGEVRLPYITSFIPDIHPDDKILIADDVFDTGRTIQTVLNKLEKYTRNIKVGTLYWKPTKNETEIRPDFFLEETADWIVFPHELDDLTAVEIGQKNPKLLEILNLRERVEKIPLPEEEKLPPVQD